MRRTLAVLLALAAPAGAAPSGPTYKPAYSYGFETKRAQTDIFAAQPARLGTALGKLAAQDPARRDAYILAVAAGGAQPLFDHEARVAAEVLAAHFKSAGRELILSNRAPDADAPLATADNLRRAIAGIASRLDPAQDLLVIYLAAHGGPEAWLATDLPDGAPLRAIDARGLRAALDAAGVRRRLIVISACFAGSWAKALTNDSTIVVAAARPDRTSFGCDMNRSITYFGEAFLEHAGLSTASFAAAFDTAKRAIAAREKAEQLDPPSDPQAYIGRDLAALWREMPARR